MVLPLIWLIGAGAVAILEGCTGSGSGSDDSADTKPTGDTWQEKPDAGGIDDDTHNDTDTEYYQPDAGVDAAPTEDVNPKPDTAQPAGLVDIDGDGFYLCGADEFALLQSGQKVNCDCDDNNPKIKPSTAINYTPQTPGYVDSNCNGTVDDIDLAKDAVRFVGESADDNLGGLNISLGDLNHDGVVDVIVAAASHSTGAQWPLGNEGKVGIFFGGAGKLVPGQTYSLDQADVTIIGGGGWYLGGKLAAVPTQGDTNNDGFVNGLDKCDLVVTATGYNSHQCVDEGIASCGDGTGNVNEFGKTALLYIKGRNQNEWQSKYAFYESSGLNNVQVIDGYSAEDLTANKMGLIRTQSADLNISYGPSFGKPIADKKFDIMLGEGGGQVHLLPLKEYLGLHWLDDVRTTYVKDHNWNSSIGELGDHILGEVSRDGIGDLLLGDSQNNSGGNTTSGKVRGVAGKLNTPDKIILNDDNQPVVDGDSQPVPYFTASGASNFDGVGAGIVIGDFQGFGEVDYAIGAPGQSGNFAGSGCVPLLMGDSFNPDFDGTDYLMNADLPGRGFVLDGDAENAFITSPAEGTNLISGALKAFRPYGYDHDLLAIGGSMHPDGSRIYLVDASDNNMMTQFQVSTASLQKVTGPAGFGSTITTAGGHVLVGSPLEDKGAAYYFPDIQ